MDDVWGRPIDSCCCVQVLVKKLYADSAMRARKRKWTLKRLDDVDGGEDGESVTRSVAMTTVAKGWNVTSSVAMTTVGTVAKG